MHISETIIPITLFIATFGVLYIFFTTRHKERLALIEKGADPSLFQRTAPRNYALKFGMFLVGISLGILCGYGLSASAGMVEEVAYFSMIFLCGGLSLVWFHFLERKYRKQDPQV